MLEAMGITRIRKGLNKLDSIPVAPVAKGHYMT
jgi:hypothetical protein